MAEDKVKAVAPCTRSTLGEPLMRTCARPLSSNVAVIPNSSERSRKAASRWSSSAARAAELLERRGRPPLGVALVGTRDVPNSSEYYYSDDDPYLVASAKQRRRRREPAEALSPA